MGPYDREEVIDTQEEILMMVLTSPADEPLPTFYSREQLALQLIEIRHLPEAQFHHPLS